MYYRNNKTIVKIINDEKRKIKSKYKRGTGRKWKQYEEKIMYNGIGDTGGDEHNGMRNESECRKRFFGIK